MEPWTCVGCSTTYRLRIHTCPRCRGTQFVQKGQPRMALWVCKDCTTKYSVDAPACPNCRSTAYYEEGEEMPKITRHGGPSNAAAGPENTEPTADTAAAAEEVVDELPAEPSGEGEPMPDAGESDGTEQESPGITRPATSANKAKWVEFAKALNSGGEIDDRDPDSLTKAQLIEVYGGYGEDLTATSPAGEAD